MIKQRSAAECPGGVCLIMCRLVSGVCSPAVLGCKGKQTHDHMGATPNMKNNINIGTTNTKNNNNIAQKSTPDTEPPPTLPCRTRANAPGAPRSARQGRGPLAHPTHKQPTDPLRPPRRRGRAAALE